MIRYLIICIIVVLVIVKYYQPKSKETFIPLLFNQTVESNSPVNSNQVKNTTNNQQSTLSGDLLFFSSQSDDNLITYYQLINNQRNNNQPTNYKNLLTSHNHKNVILFLDFTIHEQTNLTGWKKIIHFGKKDSSIRTPGVFLHNGYLVVSISTKEQWNYECWRSSDPVNIGPHSLIIEIIKPTVNIYYNHQHVKQDKLETLVDKHNRNIYVGKHPNEVNNLDTTISVFIGQGSINLDQLSRFKTSQQYLKVFGKSITPPDNDYIFPLAYNNYDERIISSQQSSGFNNLSF